MFCDRTKSATTKTTTHDVDAETNHFPCRNFGVAIMATVCICINGMWASGVGQIKHQIHFSRGQRNWRGRDPHIARGSTLAVRLHQTSCVARIGVVSRRTKSPPSKSCAPACSRISAARRRRNSPPIGVASSAAGDARKKSAPTISLRTA